jgi:hypothetical protein
MLVVGGVRSYQITAKQREKKNKGAVSNNYQVNKEGCKNNRGHHELNRTQFFIPIEIS